LIDNYLPRQCGIATFTTDACEAIANEYKANACIALPVNDTDLNLCYTFLGASSFIGCFD